MTDKELFDALDGLMAYDGGATDSGIHDEALRARVKAHLHSLSDIDTNRVLGRFVRNVILSEQSIEEGYGIEDVKEFLDWLSEYMDYHV